MRKIIFYITLVIVAFGLSNCGPDEHPVGLGPVLLGEGRDYIIFPEGSWWRYENEMTGEIDSIVMTTSFEELRDYVCDEPDDNTTIQKENFVLQAKSQTICRSLWFQHNDAWGCQPSNSGNHYFTFTVKDGCQSFSESYVFFHPFTAPKAGGGGQFIYFREVHDSLLFNDTWYYSVAEFEVDRDYIWDHKITRYFWAKGIGLVRREQYSRDQQEWDKINELLDAWQLTDHYIAP